MRQILLAFLSRATANRFGQILLEKGVSAAQSLQGIGTGANVALSGEAAVFSRLRTRGNRDRDLCIFDAGANQGDFLALASSLLKSQKFHIHSFEPSKNTFQELCKNSQQYQNATLNNFGLGKVAGKRELFLDAPGSGLASLTKRNLEHVGLELGLSETVDIATIDDYCSRNQIQSIDLLKIDVEGHELDVLEGARQMFLNSAIGMVTFEFGGCNIDTRTFVKDYFYFFTMQKMKIARITPSGYLRELSSYKEIIEQFRCTNFLCYR